MKMAHVTIVASALCSILLMPQLTLAQNDHREVDDFVPRGVGVAIPDDAYDGTIASMVCMGTDVPNGTVAAVDVDVAINHVWIGDLTIKVVPPSGMDADVLTVLSRPDYAEAADDGSGCCGDASNLVDTSGINFADGNTFDAETMGTTIAGGEFVCQDDGQCSFFPNPDTGPGTDFSQFLGQAAGGTWQVCVGDSAAGAPGFLVSANVNVSLGVPTTNRAGLALLLILLAGGGLLVLRRKATIG